MTETTILSMPDGRHVAVDTTGPSDAPAVLLFHPAPGSRRFDPDPASTAAAGVCLVTIDRPGYGRSDPLPEGVVPTITAYADDAAEVLTQLGVRDVAAVGWSAGGRVAAAVAARYPQLVRALAIAGTPAPDEEVPWIPDEQRPFVDVIEGDPAGSIAPLCELLAPMMEDRAATVSGGDADAAALSDPAAAVAIDTMVEEASRQGPIGFALDIVSCTGVPLGFDPTAIGAPTVCVYGTEDVFVTPAHGEWWASKIPMAEQWSLPDTGHLVLEPSSSRLLRTWALER